MFDLGDLSSLIQILIIDISLAGDNAIIVGMAAAGLPAEQRKKAVAVGIIAATVLRIIMAFFATKLMGVFGLMLAGGLLLLWVSWKMYRDIRHMHKIGHANDAGESGAVSVEQQAEEKPQQKKTLKDAIIQIVIADFSMSLDNVLAVAGVARDHMPMLVLGLLISVVLMGFASGFIARMVARHHWIGYVGLVVVFYTSLHMIWDGAKQVGWIG